MTTPDTLDTPNTPDYVGYIKKTKKGKFRAAFGTLHDVGEPDKDRTVWEVAASPTFEELEDVIAELKKNAANNGITKLCFEPIIKGQILWESQLKWEE